jgi:methylmalonyl-CoA epimerase
MNYPIDHIAHAVESLVVTLEEYKERFGIDPSFHEELPEQGVELVFLELPNTKIELLAPLGAKSNLRKFLDTRGPGLHHICYRVDNIVQELDHLKKIGCKLIDEAPRKGALDTQIAFIHPSAMGGVLVELCEYPAE